MVERKHVEIIATDNARRLPRAGDLISRELRNFLRQKSLLNSTRLGDFVLVLLYPRSHLTVRLAGTHSIFRMRTPLAADRGLLFETGQQLRIRPRLLDEIG